MLFIAYVSIALTTKAPVGYHLHGGLASRGYERHTIRHYTKHTIIVRVPTNSNKSHIALCWPPTSLKFSLTRPPTCCNHSVRLCVGAQLSTCWDLLHDSQRVVGVSWADYCIYVLQTAHHNKWEAESAGLLCMDFV